MTLTTQFAPTVGTPASSLLLFREASFSHSHTPPTHTHTHNCGRKLPLGSFLPSLPGGTGNNPPQKAASFNPGGTSGSFGSTLPFGKGAKKSSEKLRGFSLLLFLSLHCKDRKASGPPNTQGTMRCSRAGRSWKMLFYCE